MIQPTSSPSAKATPKTDAAPVTSGTPPLPTDPLYVDTYNDMLAARSMKDAQMNELHYRLWNLIGKLKHVLGLHTFIPLEEWDPDDGSMQYIGMVCWHCPEQLR